MLERYDKDIEKLCDEIRSKLLLLDILYVRSGQMDMKDKDMKKVRELYTKEKDIAGELTLMIMQLQRSAEINIAKWKGVE